MRAPELERYQIIGELGQGGMSVVYRARDKQLSRDVAVKVLHEFLARQPDARKRFHREAVAVAKLHHPGILEIFDYSGPDAKETYIVTELIEGETLRDFVDRRGRLEYPELAALLVFELVRALRHAHEQSVIHRDLKPENVMLTKEGVLKLMDFGLAQLMDGGTKLTATGTLLGSPAHMAPEVIDGKNSDARADIFSMGTILFWLATGKLPFEAPNPSALFKKILDGRYDDPQMLEPKIGNGLARIIKRALEPDPEQRYQDVTELGADLQSELTEAQLDPPETCARRYLRAPEAFARELGPKLVATLAASGKAALRDKNLARAMDRFNRVLAIDPDHHEVKSLVARIGRREELARRARQLAMGAAVLGIAGVTGYAGMLLYPHVVKALDAPAAKEAEVVAEVKPPKVETPPKTATVAAAVTAPASERAPPPPETVSVKRAIETLKRGPAKTKEGVRLASAAPAALGAPPAGPNEPPPPPVVEAPKPKLGKLTITIGNGFATKLTVDGAPRDFGNGMVFSVELQPGTHTLEVDTVRGPLPASRVEVDEQGAIFEIRNGKRVRLTQEGLRLRAP